MSEMECPLCKKNKSKELKARRDEIKKDKEHLDILKAEGTI